MSVTELAQKFVRHVRPHSDELVGNDGLTERERLDALVSFRAGVGRRPEMTDEFRARMDSMADKLAGTDHAVVRTRKR